MKSRIGLGIFTKRTVQGIPAEVLKGMPLRIVNDLSGSRQSLAVDNPRAIPAISDRAEAEGLDGTGPFFGVGVEPSGIDNEPFLEVVEKVVQIVSGLSVARSVKSAGELKNEVRQKEIQAELLKELFDDQALSNIVTFRHGRLYVER
jgi:hypothetical protein